MPKPLKFKNATREPRIMFGMHMQQGVAEYNEASFKGRILVQDDALHKMNSTMALKPYVVRHQDVDSKNAEDLADGWVLRSFYNPADGNHWAEFILISDDAHAAAEKGWGLSNCYHSTENAGGGTWHNVEYDQEVKNGEYEHLAAVPNPRYEISGKIGVLTPDQFKSYNADKVAAQLQLANSKNTNQETPKVKFNLFKKQPVEKIENAADIGDYVVQLKSGTEMSLNQLVNSAEESEEKAKKNAADKDKPVMSNATDRVKVGNGEEMAVGDLVNKYNAMVNEKKANAADDDKDKDKKANDADGDKDGDKKKNADDADKDKDKDKDKKQNSLPDALDVHFEALKNAPAISHAAAALHKNAQNGHVSYESEELQVERGRSKYGSPTPVKTA